MPPIRIREFSNEIIKGIVRGNNVHMFYHIHRRQEPIPVSSIQTVTLPHGPISLTLVTTSTVNDSTPTATPIATDISATNTATDISAPIPADTSTPKIPNIPSPSIPPTITTPIKPEPVTTVAPIQTIQTQNPLSPPSSILPSTTSTILSTTTSSPNEPIPGPDLPDNNTKSNNLNAWMFSTLAVLLLMMIITFLALIFRKRKRKRDSSHSTNSGDISDKDKESSSEPNSLTSSINSISSSLKKKKGKVVPADINVGSPPVPAIINNKDDEEKPQMPTLKRTPTTVSAFQELVDLTDDEHFNLRQSTSSGIYTIASRVSSTPTYVNYDAEEGTSSNAISVIPLHQERIETIIPHSSADNG
ncbi:hypothetical protein RclHR1_00350020 [Rhizophagus clarus]|uniref:Uncharacterized protein n=1 Tax=Rhizophagus clarus TaxID=94130 RepID=A0A2Z6RMI6_9GLOM|nr:hypothetical protein RclHR1_00350020 [Rhizophagus clarus]GES88448.1 hypothetical protein GLOIN_2v1479357 [Rhizophagus clarus]